MNKGFETMLTKKPSASSQGDFRKDFKKNAAPVFEEVGKDKIAELSQQENPLTSPKKSSLQKAPLSRIVIRYDVGFNNNLTIRGKGAGLSWNKGTPLKNLGPDLWTWETESPFQTLEYKVLINDEAYECGDNHILKEGDTAHYRPHFEA